MKAFLTGFFGAALIFGPIVFLVIYLPGMNANQIQSQSHRSTNSFTLTVSNASSKTIEVTFPFENLRGPEGQVITITNK